MPEFVVLPKILKFEVEPSIIHITDGDSVTFSWNTQNETSVQLQGMSTDKTWNEDSNNVAEGSYELSPGVPGEYTLTAHGDAGASPAKQVTVAVVPPTV